jgi:hypothetical protein
VRRSHSYPNATRHPPRSHRGPFHLCHSCRSERTFQETFNASFSYEVCMHASSPVKQTNEIFLQLFSPSTAPLDPPCLYSPPHPPSVLASSHVSSSRLFPPAPLCLACIDPTASVSHPLYVQPHATWMIRVTLRIAVPVAGSRRLLALRLGLPP